MKSRALSERLSCVLIVLSDESVQKSITLSEAGQIGGVVLLSINTEGIKFMYIFFSSFSTFGSNQKPEVDLS